MIRFLQKDTKLTKAIYVVIIAAASIGMVVYLIPGLMNTGVAAPNTYAEVYPHWYSKFLRSGETVTMQEVQRVARQQIQQRSPQYLDNPMILNYFTQQVGEQLVEQQILLTEANKLGISVSDSDLDRFLHTGIYGETFYPKGV